VAVLAFAVEPVLFPLAFGGRSSRKALLLAPCVPLFGGRFAFVRAARAATTPSPLKTPGLAVAATAGDP